MALSSTPRRRPTSSCLKWLHIEGLGTGLNGVNMIGGGKLIVRKCSIRNFTGNGVNVIGGANARALIEDSLIAGNGGRVNLHGAGGVANSGFLERSLVDNNTTFAVQVDVASTLVLSGSTLTGSPSSIMTTNGGVVISYGNNLLKNAGAPTQTLPLQ